MNPTISIIIPIYNSERYIKECIDSILAQTFKDFEIILIDDGSLDNSGRICDEYANNNPNIQVMHQKNSGANEARHNGVKLAKGEWISFVDSDDSLPHDALETLYNSTDKTTEIVIGFLTTPKNKKKLSLEECRSNAITSKLLPPSPCGKLYRRSCLTDDIFDLPREVVCEDMIMNIRIMFKISNVPNFVFKKVYNYRKNIASVSHTKKASLEHEAAFNQSRNASIPSDLRGLYTKEIIWSRINGITSIAYSNPKEIIDSKHPYLVSLKQDIQQNKYRLNIQSYIMLHSKSEVLVKLSAFSHILKNFIKYRLSLNN